MAVYVILKNVFVPVSTGRMNLLVKMHKTISDTHQYLNLALKHGGGSIMF